MATRQLITLDDIIVVKPLSTNINALKKVNTFIIEAQDFDLKPILGIELYLALLDGLGSSPQEEKYLNLWEEHEYTVSNRRFLSPGLKKVLCFYAWARIQENIAVEQTAFGAVGKENQFSKATEDKQMMRVVAQARSGAVAYQLEVIKFLMYKHADYLLWRGGTFKSQAYAGIKVNAIGGNDKRESRNYSRRRSEIITGGGIPQGLALVPKTSGDIDGINMTFVFLSKMVLLALQGQLLTLNAPINGYTISGNDNVGWTVITTEPPQINDSLLAYK